MRWITYLTGIICLSTICQSLPDVPVLTSDSMDGVVKGGARTILTCNSRSTTSTVPVIWFRGNKTISADIDPGYEGSADGRTLTIPVFRNNLNHKGDYCCMVNNLRSNTVTLQKARIKSFDSELKDVSLDVIVGNVAVIPCSPPASRPNAQTVFEINGDTIDETAGRYYLLPNGNLQIYPVQLSDSGSYRCVAVNPVTAEKKSAPYVVQLAVVARPAIETSPQLVALTQGVNRQISPAEGTDVVLSCVFQGYPIPRIAWQRYQDVLPLNHSVKFGNLVINRIKPEDSGTYQCLVENSTSPSPEVDVFVIDVQAKPRIGFIPYELAAYEGNSLTLNCPVTVAGSPAAQPHWYFNGIPAVPDGVNVLLNQTGENDLFIKEISLMFSGFYQCVISNSVGEDSSYIDVTIKPALTSTITIPIPAPTTPQFGSLADGPGLTSPEIVEVRQATPTGFLITWTIEEASDVVFSYQIRVKPGSDDWITVAVDIPRQATSYEINALTPGKKYRVMVVALYYGRRSAESDPSRRIRLDPDFEADYPIPDDLNTMRHIPTTSEETTHAITALSTTTYSPTTTPEPPTTTTSCTGACSEPVILENISDFDNITRNAGSDISTLCITMYDAAYRWYKDGIELTPIPGRIEISMGGSAMAVMDTRAEDSGWYVCQATNEFGSTFKRRYIHIEDPLSNAGSMTESAITASPPIVIDRRDEVYPPSKPRVTVLSPTEVQIEWDPITQGIPVKFYKIQYRRTRGGYREARWITLDGDIEDETSYKVAGLTPGGFYKFRVSAVYENNEHLQSDRSDRIDMPQQLVTDPPERTPPNMPPQLIMAKQTDQDVLTLRWLYNGDYAERFIVQYKRTDEFSIEWSEFPVPIENDNDLREMQVSISKLGQNTEYKMRVFAENAAGRSRESNTITRTVEESFGIQSIPDGKDIDNKYAPQSNNSDVKYINTDNNVGISSIVDNEMLYIILGSALGAMVLVLIILVAICGFKQRQQRQAILTMRANNSSKFADPSKMLYNEKMNGSNGNQQFLLHSSLANGNAPPSANGTLMSVHSQNKEPRMSLNINPLNEMDERYGEDLADSQNVSGSTDYNLMQHYPHYQGSINSRHTPTLPLYHQSQNSLVSHPDGSLHYSHGSLPLHQRQPHNPPHQPSGTTPQFSTFLPRTSREGSPLPAKLPHPHGLRTGHRPQSPVSSLSEAQQGGQRRKRRKRSAQPGGNSFNQSNAGSGREYMTNTDLSSDDGRELEEGHYSRALPPPPPFPNYSANLNQSDNE